MKKVSACQLPRGQHVGTSNREPPANLFINGTWNKLLTSMGLLSMSPEASLLETFLQTPTHVH